MDLVPVEYLVELEPQAAAAVAAAAEDQFVKTGARKTLKQVAVTHVKCVGGGRGCSATRPHPPPTGPHVAVSLFSSARRAKGTADVSVNVLMAFVKEHAARAHPLRGPWVVQVRCSHPPPRTLCSSSRRFACPGHWPWCASGGPGRQVPARQAGCGGLAPAAAGI